MDIYQLIVFSLYLVHHVNSDVFTSVASLEELLDKEENLIKTLENYIKAEQEKIIDLRRFAVYFNKQHYKAGLYGPTYVQNPINSFKLLKRMVVDWNEVEAIIGNNSSQYYLDEIKTVKNKNYTFPTYEDVEGAGTAIQRLGATYKMNTSSIANGLLNGVQYDTELSAVDCYLLGQQSYHNRKYKHAILWMNEAEARMTEEDEDFIEFSNILNVIHDSALILGDYNLSLDTVNRWLEMYPDDNIAQTKKLDLRRHMMDESNQVMSEENYNEVCTNKSLLSAEITSKLKCRYEDNNNPYLRIGPFKLEEVFLDPDITIFHDVLGDNEIEYLKKYSADSLERSQVEEDGKAVSDNQRISQTGYLQEENNNKVSVILRRATHMTKLSKRSFEELQVANYGIGGFYYSHYDFSKKDEGKPFADLNMGNRIATLLFYLSDVEQGGATAFPIIRAAVWPKKGSAVFWYNLFPSGDGDYRTLHSACPVLVGSKWVSNLWIHEYFQEFTRPCTLERPPDHLTI